METAMFELIDSGGAYCVLLASANIDISASSYIVNGEFNLEQRLPDGSFLYVPAGFKPFVTTEDRHLDPDDSRLHRLGYPSYVIALLRPADLCGHVSPLMQFLIRANEYGAQLFLATPAGLSLPHSLRKLSALDFVNKNPEVVDAAILGLVVLLGGNFLPNVRLKDIVELFGYGARVSAGFAQHQSPCVAVTLAMQQAASDSTSRQGVLIVQSPPPEVSFTELNLPDSIHDNYCVYGFDAALQESQACYLSG